jgi:hypothetical protein
MVDNLNLFGSIAYNEACNSGFASDPGNSGDENYGTHPMQNLSVC